MMELMLQNFSQERAASIYSQQMNRLPTSSFQPEKLAAGNRLTVAIVEQFSKI